MADKHNIPKGKVHSNCRLLPEDIVCKITQRNNIRKENTCDPVLRLLNAEITSDIQKHKQNIWKEHLDAHWDHKTNRSIDRATQNMQGYNITLTTSQVQKAIKQIKNNNSQRPDKLNIRHLKHIDLTSMFKSALNKNLIPHTWKLANIVPIPKHNNDTNKGTSYRPISLLSVIAKTLEKSLLPYITANIPNTPMQHGYKTQHYSDGTTHTK